VRLIVGIAILGFMALSAAYSLNFMGLRAEVPAARRNAGRRVALDIAAAVRARGAPASIQSRDGDARRRNPSSFPCQREAAPSIEPSPSLRWSRSTIALMVSKFSAV
jgi:hypothetical protein